MPNLSLSRTKKETIALILNALLVITGGIGLVWSISGQGIGMIEFYTEDSNLLSFLASLVFFIFLLIKKISGNEIPIFARVFKYLSVICLTITFIVVAFILSPTAAMSGGAGGYFMMFSGAMFFTHFVCPVLAFISFVFFEKEPKLQKKHLWAGLSFTGLYAVVTITLNILKVIDGPYFFLQVYNQPVYMTIIWAVLVLGVAFLIGWILLKLNRRECKKS